MLAWNSVFSFLWTSFETEKNIRFSYFMSESKIIKWVDAGELKNLDLFDAEARLKALFAYLFLLQHTIGIALSCYLSSNLMEQTATCLYEMM